MHTHRCRNLLVSQYHFHTGTPFKHAAHSKKKTLGLTNYDFDHTGLRSFHSLPQVYGSFLVNNKIITGPENPDAQ